MSYTVKNLSQLSGVSVRTLHWYDEIDLLRPAYHGSNGYRYYEEEQLLKLQQILFFRELGFQLSDIQEILMSDDFDQIKVLSKHKKSLEERINQNHELIKTINNTLEHLKGKKVMNHKELYHGFNEWAADKGKESYFIGHYDPENNDNPAEAIVLKSAIIHTEPLNWNKDDWDRHLNEANAIYIEILCCLNEGLEPKSIKTQDAIKKHCALASKFHSMTREVYLALAELYYGKKEYRDQLDAFHPKLYDYITRAMKIYAYNELV